MRDEKRGEGSSRQDAVDVHVDGFCICKLLEMLESIAKMDNLQVEILLELLESAKECRSVFTLTHRSKPVLEVFVGADFDGRDAS
ncbi:unnamed protein product [Victoria cruziana]